MIVLFLAAFLLNIANPSVAESLKVFQPALKYTAQEILLSTESARLERNHESVPATKPTKTPFTQTDQTEYSASEPAENEVQKVAAINTSSGKVIAQISEKAVENSPVLEPCTADSCTFPETHKKDEHKPITPTPTDVFPTPTVSIPPIKITLPPPCPKPIYREDIPRHTDMIPCLDVIAY